MPKVFNIQLLSTVEPVTLVYNCEQMYHNSNPYTIISPRILPRDEYSLNISTHHTGFALKFLSTIHHNIGTSSILGCQHGFVCHKVRVLVIESLY